jgi:hypothetical protein
MGGRLTFFIRPMARIRFAQSISAISRLLLRIRRIRNIVFGVVRLQGGQLIGRILRSGCLGLGSVIDTMFPKMQLNHG